MCTEGPPHPFTVWLAHPPPQWAPCICSKHRVGFKAWQDAGLVCTSVVFEQRLQWLQKGSYAGVESSLQALTLRPWISVQGPAFILCRGTSVPCTWLMLHRHSCQVSRFRAGDSWSPVEGEVSSPAG